MGTREDRWRDRDEQEQLSCASDPWESCGAGREEEGEDPAQARRTLPVSVRFPPELHAEVSAYADRLGADRTHVIVECVRQVLERRPRVEA